MITLVLRLILFLWVSFPHGDLHLRIREITQQINANPNDMELRMKRGELYLQHEEFAKAKEDFSTCIRNGFDSERVLTGISTSYMQLMLIDSALYYVDLILINAPEDLSVLELKANILIKGNKHCDAGDLYKKVVTEANNPSPLLYIQASSAYSLCNEPGSNSNRIEVLKDGLFKIPGNSVLQKELVHIYSLEKKYDEAILLQTEIINQSSFKARAFYERATLYQQTNQSELAIADLNSAQYYLTNIPDRKKEVESIILLKQNIDWLLKELGEK